MMIAFIIKKKDEKTTIRITNSPYKRASHLLGRPWLAAKDDALVGHADATQAVSRRRNERVTVIAEVETQNSKYRQTTTGHITTCLRAKQSPSQRRPNHL